MEQTEIEDTAASAIANGGNCTAVHLDVTDPPAVTQFVRNASSCIDILVCNAGGVLGQVGKPVEEVNLQEWKAMFDVNTTGVFVCAQAVAPHMKKKSWGRIITISSGAGLRKSLTGIQAYCSAKHAQVGLVKQLAHELGPFGVTVNSIAPGFVRSNPSSEKQWQAYSEETQQNILQGIFLRRLGKPEDIANAVVFLASDLSSWVTGQVIEVNGGH